MKTPDDILQTLGDLSSADRDWILHRLSPKSRKALLDGSMDQAANAKVEPIRVESNGAEDPNLRLLRAHPEQLATILAGEPAWVTHCVLAMTSSLSGAASFRESLLEQVNSAVRARVERMLASRITYPIAIQTRVRAAIVDVLDRAAVVPVHGGVEASGLTAALKKLSARLSMRRLRMTA